MKKQKYYIIQKNYEINDRIVKEVEGYVDEEKNIGYHKENGYWFSTVLSCGLYVFRTKTRKENIEKIEKDWDYVIKQMETPFVNETTKQFESLKAGDLK